jgi:hypothetical protein
VGRPIKDLEARFAAALNAEHIDAVTKEIATDCHQAATMNDVPVPLIPYLIAGRGPAIHVVAAAIKDGRAAPAFVGHNEEGQIGNVTR